MLKADPQLSPIPILTAWDSPKLIHGFLGRRGGVSIGPYESLNLAYWVGDDSARVDENWRRLREVIGVETKVARRHQIHGKDVHVITAENVSEKPDGDGMVTATPGILLAVASADCVPILMTDAREKIVAAIHAGWRGVIAGIAREAVAAMESLGAKARELRAALGPSIGMCCFEVDAELAERFGREIPGAGRHSRAGRPGKAYLDLRAIITDQLMAAGLAGESIANVGPCTRCANDEFFSRRASSISGLQFSFIGLRG
ncbi:MAG TPA: peptidoglycan editing factor PgeF [Candidatus Binataceae bacterium]|nr:peptidoglycan editing factor PgeF [Candidatus Binataceae bacterium]